MVTVEHRNCVVSFHCFFISEMDQVMQKQKQKKQK